MTAEEPDGHRPARIVRLASFVGPASGGLRTALRECGRGYIAAGHEPVLIVPAGRASDTETDYGRVITVPSPVVPGTGGCRLMVSRGRIRRRLAALRPDRVEVHDRVALRWVGAWARARGIRSVVVSHERLDAALKPWIANRSVRLADRLNRRTARAFDTVVTTTSWCDAEFSRLGVTNLRRVPLGVDLTHFHPSHYDAALRDRLASHGELLVVQCAQRAAYAIEALRNRGVRVAPVAAGGDLARLLATADVVMAPAYASAALEALACGTPVVAPDDGALREVLGDAGVVVRGLDDVIAEGEAFADGLLQIAALPPAARRLAARRQAERFGWPAAVRAMLRAHGLSIDVEVS
ncbi:glycosyltransferase [Fodinicola acaciae]|uniref:glycosyltransferase n=1 Tax=Fodinicola acaciae TaxID=2681555 RepID=UPI0013D6198E|nr:glycosyltransferase [Fodinicola acaciae]